MADKQLPTRDTAIAVRPKSIPTPEGKTERRELRSVNSKTFLHSEKAADGKELRTCQVQMGAVCYRDDNGELRSIDTTIRDLDGKIGVEWAPYKMHLHADGVGFDFWSREGGWVGLMLTGIGGEKFDQDTTLKPDIDGNVITFKDVRPGCDIVFRCLNQRVKTLRILHDASAPKTFEWSVQSDKPELIDATLTGTDAAGNQLELSSEVDGDVIRETWTGKAKVILDPATRIRSLSDAVSYPVEIDPTVNVSVTAGEDDVFERVNGATHYFYPSYTWGMFVGRFDASSVYHIGLRFLGITVPQGATITSATLTAKVLATYGAGGSAKIYGRAADNPGIFNNPNFPSSVTRTAAYTATGAISTTGVKNYDVTSVIQEIVNRAGFASGNAISLPLINATGGSSTDKTNFEPYENAGTAQASISITYTAAASGAPQNLLLLGCG